MSPDGPVLRVLVLAGTGQAAQLVRLLAADPSYDVTASLAGRTRTPAPLPCPVRTGGFVAEIADPRQLGIVFGAMDALLAGTMPFYRMEFRIRGAAANTFVSGGNAKVQLRVRVPTSLPSNGVFFSLDVAIP